MANAGGGPLAPIPAILSRPAPRLTRPPACGNLGATWTAERSAPEAHVMKFIGTRLEILFSLAFFWITAGMFWPPLSYFSRTAAPLDASDTFSVAAHAVFIAFLMIVAVLRWDEMLRGLRWAWPILP